MKVLSIRLSLWLPLLVLGLFTLLLTVMAFYERSTQEQILEAISLTRVKRDMTDLQREIEVEQAHNDGSHALRALAGLALEPKVTTLASIDRNGRIRMANRYAWKGQKASEMLPNFLTSRFEQVQNSHHAHVSLSDDGRHILAYYPLAQKLKPDELRPTQPGALYLNYNLGLAKDLLWHDVLDRNLLLWALCVLTMLLLNSMLYLLITRPLRHFAAITLRLARGEQGLKIHTYGTGELAELGQAFNTMSGRIQQTITRLRNNEEHLAITLDSIGDAVIVTDAKGQIERMNPIAERLTGWGTEEASGRPLSEVFKIINSLTREPADNPVEKVLRQGLVVGLANHTALISRSGSEYQIADSAAPITSESDEILGVVMVFRDVSEEYGLQAALQESNERFQAFTDAMPDLGFILDEQGRYLDVYGSKHTLLYADAEKLKGRLIEELLPADTAATIKKAIRQTLETEKTQILEYPLQVPAGNRLFEGRTAVMHGDTEDNRKVVWLARDITENRRAKEEIEKLAYYDALTGLSNRRLLLNRLNKELASAERHGLLGAVLFLDLDNFKTINDALGHPVGDALLQEVGKRMTAQLREEDTVARLGGDEFVVLLKELGDNSEPVANLARAVAEKIQAALSRPYFIEEHEHHITPSIGITLFPDNHANAETVLKQSDTAMYRAKARGRNTIRFYRPSMQEIADARLALEKDLRHALDRNELRLYYQPQVAATGKIIGAEALLRWIHPRRGMVSPADFIPVAEETGLILQIGSWVLQTACEHLKQWSHAGPLSSFKHLAVNISPRQFRRKGFVDQIRRLVNTNAVDSNYLTLELTEGVVIDNVVDTIDKMRALKQLGVRFSIDDFGTGYSSLSYLKQLPLDQLKIDQSFVQDITRDPNDEVIVETIISMARLLGLEVIAEGVETQEHLEFLLAKDCSVYQGFYFDRPMPEPQFRKRLKASETDYNLPANIQPTHLS